MVWLDAIGLTSFVKISESARAEHHAIPHRWWLICRAEVRKVENEIDERYVAVGHGRDYDGVPPNKGVCRGNADEVLAARVITRRSAQKAISALNEELEHIDLPVFREIPERRRDRNIILVDDEVSQQHP